MTEKLTRYRVQGLLTLLPCCDDLCFWCGNTSRTILVNTTVLCASKGEAIDYLLISHSLHAPARWSEVKVSIEGYYAVEEQRLQEWNQGQPIRSTQMSGAEPTIIILTPKKGTRTARNRMTRHLLNPDTGIAYCSSRLHMNIENYEQDKMTLSEYQNSFMALQVCEMCQRARKSLSAKRMTDKR